MKRLKIIAAGWEGYNGPIGLVMFKDGMSVEPVSRQMADRISSHLMMVEIDEDGNEAQSGVAARLVEGKEIAAPVTEPMQRLSDEEREEEARRDAERNGKAPIDKFYTQVELEAIASTDGIKGLRKIGDPWRVRAKAFNELIAAILTAQNDFLERTGQKTKNDEKLVTTDVPVELSEDPLADLKQAGEPAPEAPVEGSDQPEAQPAE